METAKTELVREIDEVVDYANQDADWRRGYMTFMQAQMDAANQGRAEGRVNTLINNVRSMVKNLNMTVETALTVLDANESDRKIVLSTIYGN